MAGKKIGELTPLGRNLIASDELELSLAGSAGSRKITGAQIIGAAGGVSSVTASTPLASSGGATPNITIPQATSVNSGFLAFTDWNAFNNKQNTLVSGTNIKTINGSSVLGSGNLTISGGRSRIVGRRDDQYSSISFLNFGQIAASIVTDIDIQFYSNSGALIKLYVSTNGTLAGATQIATYTLTADSGRFIRRFFTQTYNEGSYIDLNIRGLNSSYNAISDLSNANFLSDTVIGNDSTVFYPYLIATISAGNFESWVVEYGN